MCYGFPSSHFYPPRLSPLPLSAPPPQARHARRDLSSATTTIDITLPCHLPPAIAASTPSASGSCASIVCRRVLPTSGSILPHCHRPIALASAAGLVSTHHACWPRPPSLWPQPWPPPLPSCPRSPPTLLWVIDGWEEWGRDASCHLREKREHRNGWVRRERNASGVRWERKDKNKRVLLSIAKNILVKIQTSLG